MQWRHFISFALGALFGIAILLVVQDTLIPKHYAQPRVLSGWARVHGTGWSISFEPFDETTPMPNGNGFVLLGADWRREGEPWRSGNGKESCLRPLTRQQIRFAYVWGNVTREGPGKPVVIWFECLT